MKAKKPVKTIAAVAAAAFAAGAVELLAIPLPLAYQVLAFFATISFPPVIAFFYFEYLEAKRIRELEENLPAALFQIASFPRRTSMEKIMREIAKSDYGALSEEFARAVRQVDAGSAVPKALESMAAENDCLLLRRACALLAESYKTGADMSTAFKEVAEDVFELQAIQKQTAAALSLQKYTLLAGGCALVPLILALLLNIVSSLEFDLEGISSVTPEQRRALLDAAVLGGQAYLVIFAAIASVFVATQETNKKKAVLYFTLLFPVALAVFHFVRGLPLLG
ncbi:MAG: type II secretion system F family protein [Candidatus Micrarchaeota archaeon]